MFLKSIKVHLIFLTFIFFFITCNGPFPPLSKIGIPDDHTENIKGVLHKKGFKYPFKESSGCSSSNCHHNDLDGGVAKINDRITIAPSCFQCHETLWSDDTENGGE